MVNNFKFRVNPSNLKRVGFTRKKYRFSKCDVTIKLICTP